MPRLGRQCLAVGGRAGGPDLRVDAVSRLLVWGEEIGNNTSRQVSLHACLLASNEPGHFAFSSRFLAMREEKVKGL